MCNQAALHARFPRDPLSQTLPPRFLLPFLPPRRVSRSRDDVEVSTRDFRAVQLAGWLDGRPASRKRPTCANCELADPSIRSALRERSSKREREMKVSGGHSTKTNLSPAFMGWEVTGRIPRSSEENRGAPSGGICMGRFISAAKVAQTFQLCAPLGTTLGAKFSPGL